jgi:hypothetical protein
MKARGRPAVKPSIPLMMWVLVELMRDRNGRPRLSVRGGSTRLAKELPKTGAARVLSAETIRDYHKRFERTMKQANSGEEKKAAEWELEIGRQRREIYGWGTSAWILIADPWDLAARGWSVIINDKPILPPKT